VEPAENFEQQVESEVLRTTLTSALLACFCGRESRRWRFAELAERLKALGVKAPEAALEGALAELEAELAASPHAPWRLAERAGEWILLPKNAFLELLLGTRTVRVRATNDAPLTAEEQAVLTVIIGYRRRGGASTTRIADILQMDPADTLECLSRKGFVFADAGGPFVRWKPRPEVLLHLGYRSFSEIPALKPLEDWFAAQEKAPDYPIEGTFERLERARCRRAARDHLRRASVPEMPGEAAPGSPFPCPLPKAS
jgi:hypothetical protein